MLIIDGSGEEDSGGVRMLENKRRGERRKKKILARRLGGVERTVSLARN